MQFNKKKIFDNIAYESPEESDVGTEKFIKDPETNEIVQVV